jgi:ACS family glucarate transporter-like MFS transporter
MNQTMPVTEATTGVRWTILALLTGFSVVSYLERVNISVAAKLIKPELGLNDIQMGRVFTAFMLGYALFQIPAGRLGDRWGPRRVLALAGLSWGVLTVLTGLIPGTFFQTAGLALGSLLLLRFFLGIAESATYPVAARTIANWFPVAERCRANAIVISGLAIGSAAAAPLISWLMVTVGWHEAFYVVSIFGFLIAAVWWWFATDLPAQHGRVGAGELKLILGDQHAQTAGSLPASWIRLFRNREIALLFISYFFMNYVFYIFAFWLFLYLTEERGFSVLSGGLFATLPWLAVLLLAPLGGYASDRLSTRMGRRWGRSIVAIVGLTVAALFLVLGSTVNNAYLAVAALALCVGFLESTEGPYWAATIDIARHHAGAATGMLNMGGNLGGVVSTLLTPILKEYFGWAGSLTIGALLAIFSGIIWLWIRADRSHTEAHSIHVKEDVISQEVFGTTAR